MKVEALLKRIAITLLTIQFLIFGSSGAWAKAPNSSDHVSTAEGTQNIGGTVKQEQDADMGETGAVEQGQDLTIDQEQSSAVVKESGEEPEAGASNEEQADSNAEDKPAAEQEAADESSPAGTKQSTEESKSADGQTSDSNKSYNQEQSVEIIAEQAQKVIGAEQVDAEQEQDVTLEYKQSLKVTRKDHQSQYSKIITEQDQSISTQDDTDYVEQTMETNIDTKQKGEIDPEENSNHSLQDTEITTTQTHKAETSGDAVIQQGQSVEAKAVSKDTSSEKLSIKAIASNGVEIVKNAANTVVKIVQSIFINNKEVKAIEQEFVLENDGIDQSQEYSKTFSWGTLSVLNSVVVNKTADQDVYSLLNSVIKLNFILPKEKPDHDDNDSSCVNDSDCDGLTDDEERALGTDPFNPDTDGDRLSDYLEVKVYYTNPLNADSDGDGLSDYFEIYHL